MNRRAFPPENGAAVLVIGGVFLAVFPQYTLSTIQVVIVTTAVMAALFALEANVPSTGWMSPFRWMSPFGRPYPTRRVRRETDELRTMRATFSGWREPLPPGPPLPADTLRLLRPLIRGTLGLDMESESQLDAARKTLSPATWAVLTSDQRQKPFWFQMLPPNPRQVAEAAHRVMNELDRLDAYSDDSGDLTNNF